MRTLPVSVSEPLLRVPPFPGARSVEFGRVTLTRNEVGDAQCDQAITALVRERCAGTFWGRRPELPKTPYALVKISTQRERSVMMETLTKGLSIVSWNAGPSVSKDIDRPVTGVTGTCDPWHLVSGAATVIAQADDEVLLIAALAGVPVQPIGEGRFSDIGTGHAALRTAILDHVLARTSYANPFTGEALSFVDAVQLCAFWKGLIDTNRPIAAALGFAAWKRTTAAPLLWDGAPAGRFAVRADDVRPGDAVVVWKSRTDPGALADAQRRGARMWEAEDGFIRSIGLGADCVPPLSLVVDRTGIYFDPHQPSDLETMLERAPFPLELLDRARRLRALIVEHGVSKYAQGNRVLERRAGGRRHLLVTGQVEDDRSVQCGGGAVTSNLELLRRVRQDAPNAYILYKPHPDVEAGHRVGAIASGTALTYADEIVANEPISSLIDVVDEVHVNTSLAGFEALVRGKPVTTHGVPFYAGWGLTRDLGALPERRTARRTLDELIAAVLLLYPRYLDPVTGLPCTAEILVRRLAEGASARPGALVRLRRWQGFLRRRIAALRGWA